MNDCCQMSKKLFYFTKSKIYSGSQCTALTYQYHCNIKPTFIKTFLKKKNKLKYLNIDYKVNTSESLASTSAPPGSIKNFAIVTLFSKAKI